MQPKSRSEAGKRKHGPVYVNLDAKSHRPPSSFAHTCAQWQIRHAIVCCRIRSDLPCASLNRRRVLLNDTTMLEHHKLLLMHTCGGQVQMSDNRAVRDVPFAVMS